MDNLLRTERLDNGLVVEFYDASNRYFGDYHRVRVEVICRLELRAEHFAGVADPAGDYERARKALGREFTFARSLEKMGVAGADVEKTRQGLIQGFVDSTFPYLQNQGFVPRLVAKELAAAQKVRRPFPGSR